MYAKNVVNCGDEDKIAYHTPNNYPSAYVTFGPPQLLQWLLMMALACM